MDERIVFVLYQSCGNKGSVGRVSVFGLMWFGLMWFGLMWFGLMWFGLLWFEWCRGSV